MKNYWNARDVYKEAVFVMSLLRRENRVQTRKGEPGLIAKVKYYGSRRYWKASKPADKVFVPGNQVVSEYICQKSVEDGLQDFVKNFQRGNILWKFILAVKKMSNARAWTRFWCAWEACPKWSKYSRWLKKMQCSLKYTKILELME